MSAPCSGPCSGPWRRRLSAISPRAILTRPLPAKKRAMPPRTSPSPSAFGARRIESGSCGPGSNPSSRRITKKRLPPCPRIGTASLRTGLCPRAAAVWRGRASVGQGSRQARRPILPRSPPSVRGSAASDGRCGSVTGNRARTPPCSHQPPTAPAPPSPNSPKSSSLAKAKYASALTCTWGRSAGRICCSGIYATAATTRPC